MSDVSLSGDGGVLRAGDVVDESVDGIVVGAGVGVLNVVRCCGVTDGGAPEAPPNALLFANGGLTPSARSAI